MCFIDFNCEIETCDTGRTIPKANKIKFLQVVAGININIIIIIEGVWKVEVEKVQ